MVHLLTGDGVSRVWGPVFWVVAFFITVLHLQSHRVASGQLGGQVCAALSVSSQAGHDLPHRVLTSPKTRHRNVNSSVVKQQVHCSIRLFYWLK